MTSALLVQLSRHTQRQRQAKALHTIVPRVPRVPHVPGRKSLTRLTASRRMPSDVLVSPVLSFWFQNLSTNRSNADVVHEPLRHFCRRQEGRMHEPTKALLDAACCDRSGDRSDRMHRRVFEATQTPQSILPRQIWNSIPARPLRHTSCASSPLSNFRSRPDGAFGAESRTTLLDSDWDSAMQCHETSE